MGFGTSGAFALLVVASLITFGMVYPAMTNSAERVTDAEEEMDTLDQRQSNTEINITSATFNESGQERVRVNITNTGTTTLHVNDTAILVDNEYQTDSEIVDREINGSTSPTLWLPGEQLNITTDPTVTNPTFVRIVTEYDIADRKEF